MALHRLTSITIAVPDPAAAAAYYREFGLTDRGAGRFATADGGEQLALVQAPSRRLVELGVGADDPDDLDRVASSLAKLGVRVERGASSLTAVDPGTAVRVVVTVAGRIRQASVPGEPANRPGRSDRCGRRAPAILREDPVRPRKLGHVVLGSTDVEASQRFFIAGVGFKVSDTITGLASFLRCSEDHHNLLVQQAPVAFLHHTSWQVDDVDEIGRAATALLLGDPSRHVWGLGRHHIGSNFFWYLKDPAGNFTEYYADLDCIPEDQLWEPGVWEGMKGLFSWGPPVPPSFLAPDDLAELIASAHAGR
ncbi:MAG TPA: VOC family protein [Candidatus Bathyarchaeia archaeon]|nr:VOC family protein [Candidatus Bathyarchaeia archaeon]